MNKSIGTQSFGILAALLTIAFSGSLPAQQTFTEAELEHQSVATENSQVAVKPNASHAPQSPRLEASDLEDWLDGYLTAALAQAKIAGAVISVVQDGQLLLSKGYGYADVKAKKPMDPALTLVRPGSTSKLFTWTAVMQLHEKGKLDLNEDVNNYLDFRIPEHAGRPVTMNDLMAHRGGFEEGLREVLMSDPDLFITNEHYLKENPRPRIFAAGEAPAYSNYGTALAGYIVERISGEPFEDYVEKHILAPLEMQQSTFRQPLPPELQDNMSLGYMSSNQPPRAFELVTTVPAGSLSSTANDMANFMIAHLQDGRFNSTQILQPETAQLMRSPSIQQPPGFAAMAHGFFSARENGRWVIGHGGDTVVFHTDLNLLPEEGVGVFVSFNSRGAGDAVYGIRSRLFEDFMDRYFPGPELAALPQNEAGAKSEARAEAEKIAGSYQSTRRIETAFLGLIYLLQQSKVIANEDGTISFSSSPSKKFRQVEPRLWRDQESEHTLQFVPVNGRMTIVDSQNPTAVRQAVSTVRNATFNLYLMMASIGLLVLVLLAWPINAWYHWKHKLPQPLSGQPRLARQLVRLAALAVIVYLCGWYMALQPILQNQLDAYGPDMDGLLRTLQFGTVVPIAAAFIGTWNAWLTVRSSRHWLVKMGSLLVAGAFIGIVWIAWAGSLMNFNLEY